MPDTIASQDLEGFATEPHSQLEVEEIVSLWWAIGRDYKKNDIEELGEEHHDELTTTSRVE